MEESAIERGNIVSTNALRYAMDVNIINKDAIYSDLGDYLLLMYCIFAFKESECPQEPCKVEVVVKCKCGEREAFVECGASDCVLDLSLSCSGLCKNMSRFSRFHEKGKIAYSATLIKFARANLAYLLKIEKKIEGFIKSNDSEMIIPFENDLAKKQAI